MKKVSTALFRMFYFAGTVFFVTYVFETALGVVPANASTGQQYVESTQPFRALEERDDTARAAGERRPTVAQPKWRSRIGDDLQNELHCLALNIYFEARSEPRIGMLAVAAVTLNRVAHPRFPDSVCQVIWQGEQLGQHRCQFSWACDGRSDEPSNARAWKAAQNLAQMILSYDLADPTAGALWYHADYVEPKWASSKAVVARIGRHIYYRNPHSFERQARNAS